MILWTIQPISVLKELYDKGIFICNPNLSHYIRDEQNFKESYDWLIDKMETHIGKRPKNVIYPIWAWHTRNYKRSKPDLRESGYAERGEECVLIEFKKPPNQVMLSDFDSWHFVLNNWYIGNAKNIAEYKKEENWFSRQSPSEQNKLKKESWNKIFDITPIETEWERRGDFIQATFWELNSEEVISYRIFKAK